LVTKLRNIKYHKITKAVVFFVIVASFTLAMLQLQLGLHKRLDLECLIEPNYNMSTDFFHHLDDALGKVSKVAYMEEVLESVPFYYYINVNSKQYSNTGIVDRSYYEQFERAFFYMEGGEWLSGIHSYSKTKLGHGLFADYTAYVAFPNDFLDAKQKVWSSCRAELMPNALLCLIGLLLSLSLTVFSCIITGREQGDTAVHLKKWDKFYTELLLLALAFVIWFFTKDMMQILTDNISIGVKVDLFKWNMIKQITATDTTRMVFVTVTTILFSTIVLLLFHSLIRKWKAKQLIRDSLLYRLYQRLYQLYRYLFFGDVFHTESFAENLQYRQMIFLASTIVSSAAIAVFVAFSQRWFILPLVLEILVILWYTKGNKNIYDRINKEIREATEEQMKSERMKIELITNVSHDLKTPLTSIISFIDLLSKEDNLTEGAKDYIRILQDKSERLKNIVMDLFDLAKSTSGDVKLEYDYIDLGKLIRQTLADMDDRIEASGLSFKCKIPENSIQIYADGNKLYRVFLNIIDNTLKYAMRQTRVYIELSLINNKAVVSVKNIAGYDMNFTAQEILQRFTRGDQARTSEGSGLGLSIAESFTRVCGGELRVEVEGDMFKIYLSFDQAENPDQETGIVITPQEQQ
jgi:signal transduction histidine kinase